MPYWFYRLLSRFAFWVARRKPELQGPWDDIAIHRRPLVLHDQYPEHVGVVVRWRSRLRREWWQTSPFRDLWVLIGARRRKVGVTVCACCWCAYREDLEACPTCAYPAERNREVVAIVQAEVAKERAERKAEIERETHRQEADRRIREAVVARSDKANAEGNP